MDRDPPQLELLLSHLDNGHPVLRAGLAPSRADDAPSPTPRAKPELLWSESAAANDLAAQRWGIIAPLGNLGDRLLDVAAPLIARRRAQQGDRDVAVYRVPARMSLAEAMRWKKRVFRRCDDLDVDLPRYQLILGDLDQVPLALQQAQASDGFVGRLAFDRLDDYRAYIDKLLAWEDRPASVPAGDAILHTVRDRTAATERGYTSLMVPGHDLLTRRSRFGDLKAHTVRATGSRSPALSELFDAVRAAGDRPSVLFTLSHGAGSPSAGWRGDDQRRWQGALSFGAGELLAADTIARGGLLPGGMWVALACFGAGTNDRSDYYHWLDTLARAGHGGGEIEHVLNTLASERPFIAAVPKAALAHPDGPLGFIGHVDLAWAYSFFDLSDRPQRRPGRLMGVVQSLLRRDRAGVAMRALSRFFEETNTELTALFDAHQRAGGRPLDARARAQRGHLWMLRQDLAGYILLGDPAAHLPLAAAPAQAARAPAPAPAWGRRSGARARAAPNLERVEHFDHLEHIERLERAICALLAGRSSPLVAAHCGLDRRRLEHLAERYRTAGRAALRDALASSANPDESPQTDDREPDRDLQNRPPR